MRQEDVAVQPEVELHRLYTQLGLTWSDEVAGRVAAATREGNPAEAPHGRAHTAARDSRAAVSAWRQRLTTEQVSRVRKLVEPVAGRYYADSDW